MKRRTYGYNRVKLYEHYTADELAAWSMELASDPANANPDADSLYLLNAVTRKRVENITYAISYHHQDQRRQQREASA